MKDLRERTIRGGAAKLFGQVTILVLRLGSVSIMARLLEPKDYGLVGMVAAVAGILDVIKDGGLSSACIQRASITAEQHSTVFWINLLLGGSIAMALAMSAPYLASFYREPRLFSVTLALALVYVIRAAAVQHSALMRRQMRFTALAAIDVSSLLVSISVGIGMAYVGFRYWSLVGMALSGAFFETCAVWYCTKWVPLSPRRGIGLRSFLGFGGTVTLNGIVMYVTYNLDKVLIGRFCGAEALGIYGRGQQLANLPTESLNGTVGAVAFSALSRLQDDPVRYRNYFLKGYALVLSLTLPTTIFCAIYADVIIHVVLGSKWDGATVTLRLMTPTILVFGMINPFGEMLKSLGLQLRSLRIALVIAPLVITAFTLGLAYGPNGVALSFSTAMALWLIPHIIWCVHGTMITPRDILGAIGRPYLAALAAVPVALALHEATANRIAPFPQLILGGGALYSAYFGVLLFALGQKELYLDVFRTLKGVRP